MYVRENGKNGGINHEWGRYVRYVRRRNGRMHVRRHNGRLEIIVLAGIDLLAGIILAGSSRY